MNGKLNILQAIGMIAGVCVAAFAIVLAKIAVTEVRDTALREKP
jgi:hypothetical protein